EDDIKESKTEIICYENQSYFDFVSAKEKCMQNIKINGDHWIWGSTDIRIKINGKRFAVNLLLTQCELGKLLPKGSQSKNTCGVKNCVNPEHWILRNNIDAEYKLAEIRLLKHSKMEGKC